MNHDTTDTDSNDLDRADVTIGMREVWGGHHPFGLSAAERRQHVYCVGKTGTGKTTLLRNMILQDIETGRGVGVIDPHGDLAEELLECFPTWRADHLAYFNPSDLEHPFSFNLLAEVNADARHRVASGVVAAFKSIWRDSWGPRLEYVLFCTVAALLECRNVSLLGAQRMLVDEQYREWIVRQVSDPIVRSFWAGEFANWDDRFRAEVVAPVQNKLGALLTAAPVRNVLGQVRNRFDARFVMDNGRVFIANLSRGRLGEDKANLLGALLVAQFYLAAMGRADVSKNLRRDFTLVCDEFPGYATDTIGSILSQSRKYALNLVLVNQYLDQLDDVVRSAVFGNCGTLISYRVGESDAAMLSREFGDVYPAARFTESENYEVLVKTVTGATFSGTVDPPAGLPHARQERLIQRNRQRYAAPRAVVEAKIARWLSASIERM